MTISEADVALVPPLPNYAATYLSWRREPNVTLYNPQLAMSRESLATRLQLSGHDLRNRHHDEYRWFVTLHGDLAGTVSVKSLNWTMQYGEIGYHVAEAHQGKGLATIAVTLLLDKIFTESTLMRILAVVSTENHASRRILEKLHFTLEGTMRQHVVIQGRRHDQWLFGLLRPEWKKHRR